MSDKEKSKMGHALEAKNKSKSLNFPTKPKRPQFSQKPMRRTAGRGR